MVGSMPDCVYGDVVTRVLAGLDDNISDYITSLLQEHPSQKPEDLQESIGPFLLSTEYASDDAGVTSLCKKLSQALQEAFIANGTDHVGVESSDRAPTLLSAPISFKDQASASDDKMMDLLWGKDKVRSARNETLDRAKQIVSKRQERRQKRLLDIDEELDEDEQQQVSTMILPDYSGGNGEKDIVVLNISLRFAGQELLASADLKLAYKRRYGLIGANGIGKTTLLKHIAAFDIEGFPRHLRVLHVRQEVQSSSRTVLDMVLQSDIEREVLLEEEREILAAQAQATDANNTQVLAQRLTDVYARLAIISSDSAEARAASILTGLQFGQDMQSAPISSLSGGWRMRVALASALFIEPDLLLLDEPTNHLDLEACLWLQEYLKSYKHTVLLVSHDRAFLNEVATDIIEFASKTLTYWRGNFDTFEAVKSEKLKNAERAYEANVAKRAHMQDFIDRFRYNANRAALVQSRIKALEKMEVIEKPEDPGHFRFQLPTPEPLSRPILSIEQVTFGYPSRALGVTPECPTGAFACDRNILFEDTDFSVDLDTRIAIVGPNGAGKSTLLNLILDKLTPLKGRIFRHQNLRVAAFTQHHADSFDLRMSALDNFEKLRVEAGKQDTLQELRSLIGRFGLSGDDALRPMRYLSGGQKSRAAFALLAWRRPHVVVLDEPTNHLDLDTIQALIDALKEFRGGLLCVSHDQHFIQQVCSELYVCGNGRVARFPSSFEEYKRQTLARVHRRQQQVISRQ